MANAADLAALLREREKHEAALASAQGKISAIEGEERRKREEEERKQRELASLQGKRGVCLGWISRTEKDIVEFRETVAREVGAMSEGHGEVIFNLRATLHDLATEELVLAALKEYEAMIAAKIEANKSL